MSGRTRKKRRRGGMPPELLRGIVIVAAIGLCVYVALATAVGNFVAEKIVAPVFRWLEGENGSTTAQGESAAPPVTEDPATSAAAENSQTQAALALLPQEGSGLAQDAGGAASGEKQQGEIHMESRSFYALQLGAFSSEQNAQTEGRAVQQRAAGGYVYNDGVHYRVLAAVYNGRETAKTVKAQLMEQNSLDSSIYQIDVPAVALRVTAGEEQLAAVQTGFERMSTVCDELLKLCEQFDKEEKTIEAVQESLRKLAKTCREPAQILSSVKEGIAAELCRELEEKAQRLEECAEKGAGGRTEFSSALKYAHISEVCAYSAFAGSISDGA